MKRTLTTLALAAALILAALPAAGQAVDQLSPEAAALEAQVPGQQTPAEAEREHQAQSRRLTLGVTAAPSPGGIAPGTLATYLNLSTEWFFDGGTKLRSRIVASAPDPWQGRVATGGRCNLFAITPGALDAWAARYPLTPFNGKVHHMACAHASSETDYTAGAVAYWTGSNRCVDSTDLRLSCRVNYPFYRPVLLTSTPPPSPPPTTPPKPDNPCPGGDWQPAPIPAAVYARCRVWYDDLAPQCCWLEYSSAFTSGGRQTLCNRAKSCAPGAPPPPPPPPPGPVCGDGECDTGEPTTCPVDCPQPPPPPPADTGCTAALDLFAASAATAAAAQDQLQEAAVTVRNACEVAP